MKLFISIAFITSCILANAQQPGKSEAEYLHRAQNALTDVIVHDIFSPPVASRIYLYANLAAYEALAMHKSKLSSFAQIKDFPFSIRMSSGSSKIDLPVAAIAAFLHTGTTLIFSEQRMVDSARIILGHLRQTRRIKTNFEESVRFGKQLADSILAFAAKDRYRETRSLRRFSVNAASGRWIPTPPAYMAAVEPHWGKMRPFILDSASQFRPPVPLPYLKDSTSGFHQQALEVYNTVQNITPEQKNIAAFWDCNPFFVNTSGHLVFATKKLSPGGHWMSIAGIAARRNNADIYMAAKGYTFTAIALYDAFISCWDEKYRSNYIRPETYINSNIDESWRPLLQTPPFPEYTSGHSVISNAAAVILTTLYGDQVFIEDNTEVPYGLPVRTFHSFRAAADEAAVSRLYGGIHFREAIENGKEQGIRLGQFILGKLTKDPGNLLRVN